MDERHAALRASFGSVERPRFCLLGIASHAEPSDQATAVLTDEKDLTFAEGVFHDRAQKLICYSHTFLLLAPYGGSS